MSHVDWGDHYLVIFAKEFACLLWNVRVSILARDLH